MHFFKRFSRSEDYKYRKVMEDGAKYPASTILPTQEETATPRPPLTLEPGGINAFPADSVVTYLTYLNSSMVSRSWMLARLSE